MRYRKLTESGDYSFGNGSNQILVNSPDAVAQAVSTRLALHQGEWFLDSQEGMPWSTQVFGTGTRTIHDSAIQQRILGTPGVLSIDNYQSYKDASRKLVVSCFINTLYGSSPLQQVL